MVSIDVSLHNNIAGKRALEKLFLEVGDEEILITRSEREAQRHHCRPSDLSWTPSLSDEDRKIEDQKIARER